jgi:curli biogenesis system outer membrane secretion channel CsgG
VARRAPIALFAALMLAGCATVKEPTVVRPDRGADVSPTAQEPKHLLKRRVVIARFSNESLYGKSVLLGDKASMIGQMASDTLASRLVASDKFLLFERSDSEAILDGLNRGTLRDLKLPADYLIVGSLSEFGRSTSGETGVFSHTKKQTAKARVNLRLVDAATAQVIYSEEGVGEAETETGTVLGIGTKAGDDSTLDSEAISAAISKLVSNVVENLMAQPWRSYVLARDGDRLIIGGGTSQGLRPGQRLALIQRGRRVENPQTGIAMELPGEKIATLQVQSCFGNTPETEGSTCALVSGANPTEELSQYVVEEERR